MGVTKQNILKNVSTAEIFKYPEYLRDVIIRPYDDTPYKKGGKLTRKIGRDK